MSVILAIIEAILKLFGLGAEAAKEAKDQQTGAELQKGADAEATVKVQAAEADAAAQVPTTQAGLAADTLREDF